MSSGVLPLAFGKLGAGEAGRQRVCRLKARRSSTKSRHTPPPGLSFGEPDDRLQRSIPYAAAYRFYH